MKREQQESIPVTIQTLAAEVQKQKDLKSRLVQIGCGTVGETFELHYSFEHEGKFTDLKLVTDGKSPIASITGFYFAAFTYENEIADLYGLQITGNALDFKGTFITTSIAHPFAPPVVTRKPEESR